ncbi:glycolate oxidase subunit GlcE [Cupriavidus sp. 30B13]|uniref:glycolate oxidase subunit GlcE n=1 Tax=Cupriavidus sp. 30B13 TaxID=3384241 RepID=UPI003B903C76
MPADQQATLDAFRDTIRRATDARTPLRLRGGGSKDFYGQQLQGEVLDTRGYSGIVDYDPPELVITARCGTPLAEIEAALAERRQMLAFEPPHFGAGATLGGAVAAGLSGPRRQAVGALRDFVLGVRVMDGRGDILDFGGQVMKNVAGYDVSRLMAGSLGTLGLILEVSLKVLPVPFDDATLRFAMGEAEVLERLNQWGGQPLPVAASAWHDGVLHLRLSGAAAAVRAARERLGGEAVAPDEAVALWRALRDQQHPFFAPVQAGRALWRIAVPTTAAPLALPGGGQLIEWGGGQRWWLGGADSAADAAAVRAAAAAAGGHATLFRNGDKAAGVFTPLAAPLHAIHQRLKAGFDPAGIFNPQRMYAGL